MLSCRTFSLFSCRILSDFSKKQKNPFLSLIKTIETLSGSFLLGLPLKSLWILHGGWQQAQIYVKLLFKYDIQSESELWQVNKTRPQRFCPRIWTKHFSEIEKGLVIQYWSSVQRPLEWEAHSLNLPGEFGNNCFWKYPLLAIRVVNISSWNGLPISIDNSPWETLL